jgi:hypothetical protein
MNMMNVWSVWMSRDDECVNVWLVLLSRDDEWDDWVCDPWMSRDDELGDFLISVNEQRGRTWWMCDQCDRDNEWDDWMISFNEQRWWIGWPGVISQWAGNMNGMTVGVISEWAEMLNGMTVWSESVNEQRGWVGWLHDIDIAGCYIFSNAWIRWSNYNTIM